MVRDRHRQNYEQIRRHRAQKARARSKPWINQEPEWPGRPRGWTGRPKPKYIPNLPPTGALDYMLALAAAAALMEQSTTINQDMIPVELLDFITETGGGYQQEPQPDISDLVRQTEETEEKEETLTEPIATQDTSETEGAPWTEEDQVWTDVPSEPLNDPQLPPDLPQDITEEPPNQPDDEDDESRDDKTDIMPWWWLTDGFQIQTSPYLPAKANFQKGKTYGAYARQPHYFKKGSYGRRSYRRWNSSRFRHTNFPRPSYRTRNRRRSSRSYRWY